MKARSLSFKDSQVKQEGQMCNVVSKVPKSWEKFPVITISGRENFFYIPFFTHDVTFYVASLPLNSESHFWHLKTYSEILTPY